MSKKTSFAKELKIVFKWANILYQRENSNTEEEPVQTTGKTNKNRSKKINIKSSKAKTSKDKLLLKCESIC